MRTLARTGFLALLYGAFVLGANPIHADALSKEERTALLELRDGDMSKLVVHKEARPRIDETWQDREGNTVSLADFAGKVVVLNFWATWCPPCRAEMPSIDRLAGEMGGEDLEVVALSTDRFGVEKVVDFFEEIEVQNLAVHQDRAGAVARRAGALGLPVTVILDREGREVARVTGEAEWDAPVVKAILQRLIEMTASAS